MADLVGLADIAKWLGVARQTAKTWRQRGVLPEPDEWISGNPAWKRETIRRWCRETDRAHMLGEGE